MIAVGRLGINDELLPATFRLLDLFFPSLLEEIHDAGHSLGVGLRSFHSRKNHLRDRLTIDDEASRALLGVIANDDADTAGIWSPFNRRIPIQLFALL